MGDTTAQDMQEEVYIAYCLNKMFSHIALSSQVH